MNDTEKLDLILKRLDKIERTVNPPVWKVTVKWCFDHFLILFGIGTMLYASWKTWVVIHNLETDFENLKMLIVTNKEALKTTIDTGLEKVNDLKFW